MKSNRLNLKRREALLGYLFTLPWVVGFVLLTLFPLVYSLYMSTQRVEISAEGIDSKPIGFANFVYALTVDFPFIEAVIETMQKVVILTPLIVIISLIIAMLLNQKLFMRGLFRAIFFLPVIIISGGLYNSLERNGAFSIVDLQQSSILRWMEYSELGIVFSIIELLISNIFIVMWLSGVQILIYLSGLQKLSKEIYEAAEIDGATRWQRFWKLTFPAMNHFTILNLVYTIVLLSGFSAFPLMGYIKDKMFGYGEFVGLGYTSALAWIYFVLVLIVLFIFLFLSGFRFGKRKGRV